MTSREVLVSIVTPTRNMATRLERCIASVAVQTHPAVEHIVIDGASTDGSVAVLERSSGVTWVSEPDRGQPDALVKGFLQARGDVLTWLNADDVLLPDAVERVVEVVRRHPDGGLFHGDMVVEAPDRSWLERSPREVTYATLLERNVLAQPSTFFSRAAYDAAGGIDDSLHYTMDYDLWLRILRAGFLAHKVDGTLASFELHGGSKTGSGDLLAFAADEARSILKQQEVAAAMRSLSRWFGDDASRSVGAALSAGDLARAKAEARAALAELPPAIDRTRVFLWLASAAPRLAALTAPLRRNPVGGGSAGVKSSTPGDRGPRDTEGATTERAPSTEAGVELL